MAISGQQQAQNSLCSHCKNKLQKVMAIQKQQAADDRVKAVADVKSFYQIHRDQFLRDQMRGNHTRATGNRVGKPLSAMEKVMAAASSLESAREIRDQMGIKPAQKEEGAQARSSSSSSSSSSSKPKKKKRKKKRSSSSSSEVAEAPPAASEGAPAVESDEAAKAKSEVLVKLQELQKVHPKEQRQKAFRALLRSWHPDKNPERVEVATEVFQFLQKGKSLLD